MVRQARIYLATAGSGAALIAAAIALLVTLILLSGLRDFEIAGFGGQAVAPIEAENTAGARAAAIGATITAPAGPAGAAADAGTDTGAPDDGPTPAAPDVGQVPAPDIASVPDNGVGPNGDEPDQPAGQPTPTPTTPSGNLSGTVGGVVDEVDAATGGALSNTGVAGTVKGAVEGLAGPNTPVGQTVDSVGSTLNDLTQP